VRPSLEATASHLWKYAKQTPCTLRMGGSATV
jgi:hypothetical protein